MTLQEFESRGQDYADLRDALRENATLRAVHVQLLTACEAVKDWIEDNTFSDIDELSDDAKEILETVRAAVAKARKEVS